MCNLYRMTRGVDEIARLFAVEADNGANFAEEVYPGYPGLVVAEGRARPMSWGFPLVLKGKQGQALRPKPVTNARDDKLSTAFWRDSFARRRCLVPVSAWAEPEGEAGRMTRTWHGLPDGAILAVASLWRPTAEWGDAYTLVMTESSEQMADVHDRMPVILEREDWARWTDGDTETALSLCRTWPGALVIERTGQSWAGGGAPPVRSQLL